MKKALILALAVLPVLFACNKNNANTNGANLETPKNAKDAAKVTISQSAEVKVTTKDKKEVALKEINFMRSGRYIAVAELIETKASNTVTLAGTYSFSNGKYSLSGDLTVTVSTTETSVSVTTSSGETQTADATVTASTVQEGSTQDKICRTWVIDHLILNFEKLGGEARYDSIKEIVNDIKAHKIELKPEQEQAILNHDIKEITLDEGIICVTFANAEPFKGSWQLSANNTFSYKIENFNGSVFSAEANGTISFNGDLAVVDIVVKSDVKDLGNGTAKLTLKAVN